MKKKQIQTGTLYVVGLGPGAEKHLTFKAREALEQSEIIIGYKTYIELIDGLFRDKQYISTGMGEEIKRVAEAVSLTTAGKTVSLVSSGDPGIYGMAGLVLEFLHSQDQAINLQIIPGVPALCATAALLGAPLMHDFASISLSDRLTPWQTITTRLQMAAEGDFVITIYNPKSRGRQWQLTEAREILLRYRDRSTPVGIVRNAYRKDQKITITDLAHMLDFEVDMFTTIVIGNASTFISGNWIVTPRGYQTKYKLNSEL